MLWVIWVGGYLVLAAVILLLTVGCLRSRIKRKKGTVWIVLLFLLLTAMPIVGAVLTRGPLKFFLQAAGNVWMGFCLFYGGILAILALLAKLISLISRKRFSFRPLVAVATIASIAVCAYGSMHAQHPVVTEYDITLDTEGPTGDLNVVLIADLHLSMNSCLALTQKTVEAVNAQDPDLVLVAGDIFTSSYEALAHPEEYAKALSEIQSRYGVYMVYGNHDVEETLFGGFAVAPVSEAIRSPEMEQFFADSGFTVLTDELVTVADGALQLAGRLDGTRAGDGTADRASVQALLAEADPALPLLVLEHEPLDYEELANEGADLILSGHTHNGQIFPGNLVVPYFNENGYGYKVLYDTNTVLTAGVGYFGPPMRVGTNSEVTVIHLHLQ